MEQTNKHTPYKKNLVWKIDKFLVNVFYIADFTKTILKMQTSNYVWVSNLI